MLVTEPRPEVSVVVPVHNRRALLRELLLALDRQTFRDFEVIVVDDGSDDGSDQEAATKVGGRTVQVVRTRGVGAVEARRLGVAVARGPYLAFTDSDCRPTPGWLDAGVNALKDGAAVVNGPTVPARPLAPLERSVVSGTEGLFPTCNVFYERGAFDAAGGFDVGAAGRLGFRHNRRARGLGFGEDTLLAWAVQRAGGEARHVPAALVEHHVFAPDLIETISRAWMTGAFTTLISEVPELRATFVRRGVLFGQRNRVPLYALVVALLLRRRLFAALAAGWWTGLRWRELSHASESWQSRAKAIPLELAIDAVTAAGLVVGSVRSRTPLL